MKREDRDELFFLIGEARAQSLILGYVAREAVSSRDALSDMRALAAPALAGDLDRAAREAARATEQAARAAEFAGVKAALLSWAAALDFEFGDISKLHLEDLVVRIRAAVTRR